MKRKINFIPLASLMCSAIILLLTDRAVANAVLRSMFSCQAQGLGGVVPTITVWYHQGTNLSFLPSGETIKKVWLADISQVIMDFDGPMCMQLGQERPVTVGDCQNSRANVIHLKRIKRLNIPGTVNTDNTLLTVITEGPGGTKLYTFRILYGEGAPDYHSLAIYPDPPSASETPCVRVGQ